MADSKKQIEQGLKGMRPGQVMMAVAKQMDMTSAQLLKKKLLPIIVAAAKAGKVKAGAIKDAVKDFKKKNAEDKSGIDWDKLELDPSTMTFKCLFDGESKKKLEAFMKEYESAAEGAAEEAEADNKKLHAAVKKTGLDMSDEEVDENGIIVANSLSGKDKKNKKKVSNDIKQKIKLKKELEDSIKKMRTALAKLEAAGVDEDDAKKSLKESNELVNEDENWTKDHFDDILAGKYSVAGGSVVDSQMMKNVIYNFASKEKDPEKVVQLVRDWMNSNKKLFSAPSAFRDFMSGQSEKLSNNSLSEFIKLSCKNVDGLKAHVSQAVLDGSSTFNVDYALASSWSEGDKMAEFDDVLRELKNLEPSNEKSVATVKACIEAYKNYCAQYPANDVIDGGAFNRNALQAAAAMFQQKTGQTIEGLEVSDKLLNAAEKYKDNISSFASNAEKIANDNGIEEIADKSTKAASNAKEVVSGAAGSSVDKASDLGKDIADAAAKNAIDSDGRVFNYKIMYKELGKLEDIFDDGKITPDEMKMYVNFNSSMMEYQNWAIEHANSTDPQIQQRCAAIMMLSRKFNDWEMENYDNLQELSNPEFDSSKLPPEGKKLAASAAGDESMKEASKSWLGKAFSALGIVRLAAKTTGVILNKGKDVVDCIGAYAMKQKEDKGVIAELKFILSNAKDSDTKFDDTKFSVRYDVDDRKWHATCLDNRKLKFPEDEVVKKVLSSDTGKKFKEYCLSRWSDIFDPTDKKKVVIPFILSNFEKFGIKADGKTKAFAKTLKKVDARFDEIKKAFSSSTNESQLLEDEKDSVDISDEIEKNEELKKDSKTLKVVKAIWNVLKKPLKSIAGTKAGDLIDELLLGQFKDALIKVYKDEKLDKLKGEAADKELEEIRKATGFQQGEEYSKLDSRKDDNESTAIDKSNTKFWTMWHSKEKDENIASQISDIVVEIQKQAKKLEDDKKELVAALKKLKIDVDEKDIQSFGPVLKKMVDDKASADEIKKKLKKLKGDVKESCQKYADYIKLHNSVLLKESQILTEKQMERIYMRVLLESKDIQDAVYEQLIMEGFFGNMLKSMKDKVKDVGGRALKYLGNKTLQGIVSLGGLAVSIATGGWGAALIIRTMYIVERHGKALRNSFERQWKKFANSGGVFTKMDFKIEGQEKSSYSMRFYGKDMVWRVINTADQLKMPGKDWAKAIVESEVGKQYRDKLKEIWDPIFSKSKGGKVDFAALFEQSKDLKISEKQLKLWKDFADNYDKIVANCIEDPKIDTRTQSVKKDKYDK